MSSYETPGPGKWVQPTHEGYTLQCCDCGLVHRVYFRTVHEPLDNGGQQHRVQFRAYRDNRATAAVRRERKKREALRTDNG